MEEEKDNIAPIGGLLDASGSVVICQDSSYTPPMSALSRNPFAREESPRY